MVFDINMDGNFTHKSILVVVGHKIEPPSIDGNYQVSTVISSW